MKKPYFKKSEDDPAPLRGTVERQVRFNEVDMLGIAWHGHFVSYFEDARIALGQQYEMGYMDLFSKGIMAPVKSVHVDFVKPLKFMETITIEGIFHYTRASRINSEYVIRNSADEICATGYCIQMMLTKAYELFLIQPEYIKNFCDKWKAGKL